MMLTNRSHNSGEQVHKGDTEDDQKEKGVVVHLTSVTPAQNRTQRQSTLITA